MVMAACCHKEMAKRQGSRGGVHKCLLCQGKLHYVFAEPNNHFRAKCDTELCINVME